MKITTGLFPNCVWQRGANNLSDQLVTGCAEPDCTLICAVRGRNGVHQTIRGIRTDAAGNFSFRITDLPIGGPYVVSIADDTGSQQVIVDNILIGDLWLLAGQSNMQGVGALEGEPPAVDSVRFFGLDHCWGVAHGRLHDYRTAAAPVYNRIRAELNGTTEFLPRYDHTGIGPGTAFGQYLFKKTGVPQGLVPAALGGTAMAHWDPEKKDAGPEGSLYAAMLDSIRLTGGRISGLFWYQGCSDTGGDGSHLAYADATRKFFAALKSDLNFPDMPVVMVQIAGVVTGGMPDPACDARWAHVREAQRNFQEKTEKIAVVPACDLCYEDGIHLDQTSQYVLGRRCGEAMCALLGVPGVPPMPIELEKMEYRLNERLDAMEIEVTYRNVSGALSAACGRPALPWWMRTAG